MPKVTRVLVGVDGSDDARRALEWAMMFAQGFGAELLVLHAVGLLAQVGEEPPQPSQGHLDELRQAFEDDWCAPLAGSSIRRRLLLADGPPVLALLEAAEREAADLIVVGRRGVGGFPEILLGSTSHQVVERSRRPVVIVPPSSGTRA